MGDVAQRTTALTTDMAEGAQRANEAISSVSAVAQEAAATTQEVSASTEEVTAQIGELSVQAKELANIAADMSKFLARFGALAHNSEGERFKLAA